MEAEPSVAAEEGARPPGRRGLREGLMREVLEPFLVIDFIAGPDEVDTGAGAGVGADTFGGVLPFAFAFPLSIFCCPSTAGRGGERPLPRPRRPRFMILAGVTGESAEPLVEVPGDTCADCRVSAEIASVAWVVAEGGGIDRSTGEGVSPTISLAILFLLDCARIAGVEPTLADPRARAAAPAVATARATPE